MTKNHKWDELLRRFYAENSGKTHSHISQWKDQDGASTYERIVEYSGEGQILDLGCGDGSLVGYMNHGVFPRYHGTDVSSEELDVARAKFPELADRFRISEPDQLCYGDGIFSDVLAHMVFHVVSDRQTTAREVFRVLEPGGKFTAVVRWKTNVNTLHGELAQSIKSYCKEIRPDLYEHYNSLPALDRGSLEEILIRGAGFSSVNFRELGVTRILTEEDLWTLWADNFPLSMFDATEQKTYREKYNDLIKRHDLSEPYSMQFCLFQARK